ncbi:hypothetical protein QQS21_010565 [Conoideocrella luteorostrata]|uniref:RING-CH-type domain-containing protein n=1 Tax=Conoideocrella luteorostrata TaxID=1105319 RepID=A0AAJ0CEY5_9HYPO|nr:hypothetical protein QQS21_010565 [Conoideocrella luteorostrata]
MDTDPASKPAPMFDRQRSPYSAPGQTSETFQRPEAAPRPRADASKEETPRQQAKPERRRYRPRTCRICLDSEYPQFPSGISSTFGVSTKSSRPVYESTDPELGRLLSPCKCKGSAKYVHEGCLKAWRLTNPSATRNFWQCPTCKFTYRLARLHWASRLSSKWAQIAMTVMVFILSLFALGFIADPILDLWFDPVGSITDTVSSVVFGPDDVPLHEYQDPTTWTDHFTKGLFSLGLIGAIKSFIAMGPWHWINLRAGGLFGSGRRGGTGRSRMDNFNLLFVAIGAFTFMMATWKFVKAMSARVLTQVSNNVMDVGNDDDDDVDDEPAGTDSSTPGQENEENRNSR